MQQIIDSSIYLLSCVLFMGVLLFVIDRFLTRKGYALRYSFIWLCVYIGISVFVMPSDPTAPTFMTMIFVALYTIIFYRESIVQKILILILSMISILLIEILLKTALTFLFKVRYGALHSYSNMVYSYFNFAIEYTLIGIYSLMVNHKKLPLNISVQSIPKRNQLIYSFILIFTLIYSVLIDYQLEELKKIKNDSFSYFLMATLFLLVIVVIGFFIILQINAQNDANKRSKAIAELQLSYQLKHYHQLESAMQETRKIKHDMKHHLICLSHLLHDQKTNDALNYISEMEGQILTISYVFETGNNIIDAILNEKNNVALKEDIILELKGMIPANLDQFIKPIDICTIISNSLDNAIEATIQYTGQQKRKIEILSNYHHGTWLFSVHNPSNPIFIKSNGLIQTTKLDSKYHGFGLLSIKETVLKYSGSADFEMTNDQFTLDILIQLETKW